ncbi:MAG: GNAT family N-acetyltransferase [Limnothrix sp. RL_2_0]|nr:GNAT family N-acetyltransferase [Limnothrix sp. RL_2_0]
MVRPATVQDARPLADILTYSFHSYSGLKGLLVPILRLGVYEDLSHRLRQPKPHHACFAACFRENRASVVVGTVEVSMRYLRTKAIAPVKFPYISNLAVNPDYRRLGVARLLLQRCETQVRYWNYSNLALHVLENNEAAKQLYLRSGYEVQQVENSLNSWLLKRPRRLFCKKIYRLEQFSILLMPDIILPEPSFVRRLT